MSAKQWTFPATVLRVVDGDTVWVDVVVEAARDIGFRIRRGETRREIDLRLEGINAPEKRTPAGPAATAALAELLPAGSQVTVITYQDPAVYNRYTATVITADGTVANTWMVEHGFAARDDYR